MGHEAANARTAVLDKVGECIAVVNEHGLTIRDIRESHVRIVAKLDSVTTAHGEQLVFLVGREDVHAQALESLAAEIATLRTERAADRADVGAALVVIETLKEQLRLESAVRAEISRDLATAHDALAQTVAQNHRNTSGAMRHLISALQLHSLMFRMFLEKRIVDRVRWLFFGESSTPDAAPVTKEHPTEAADSLAPARS